MNGSNVVTEKILMWQADALPVCSHRRLSCCCQHAPALMFYTADRGIDSRAQGHRIANALSADSQQVAVRKSNAVPCTPLCEVLLAQAADE